MSTLTVNSKPKTIKPSEFSARPIAIGPNDAAEFWRQVQKGERCWTWQGQADYKGYGRFKGHPAHRFSFAMTYYLPPPDMQVCHTCDNPGCVRPDHLVLGSPLENVRDMINKGRDSHGPSIANYHSKNDTKVTRILELGKQGVGLFDIAKQLSVPVAVVRRVRNQFPKSEGGTYDVGSKQAAIRTH